MGADHFTADFADLSQVRTVAQKMLSRFPHIDVLANNAGSMKARVQMTADGYEHTYQVNYLAPFLLTTLLLDVLVDSRASVINTSSSSRTLLGKVSVEDIENTHRCRPSKAYALSKLANILFIKELHRRYHGAGLSAAAFHPGYVDSNFGPASGWRSIAFMGHTPLRRLVVTADRAADQLVWLASGTPGIDWKSGEYYSRHKIAKPNRAAYDSGLARELWDRSFAHIAT